MSQASQHVAFQRIESGLLRLEQAILSLSTDTQSSGADNVIDMVDRTTYDALAAAHELLRARAEAAITGIDRLLNEESHR